MKRIGVITAAVVLLTFGNVAGVFAQQDQQQEDQKEHGKHKGKEDKQKGKPEKSKDNPEAAQQPQVQAAACTSASAAAAS